MAYDEDKKKRGSGDGAEEGETVSPDSIEEVLDVGDEEEEDPLMTPAEEDDKWE